MIYPLQILLLCVMAALACSRLNNGYDETILNCGALPNTDSHFVQIFDPHGEPMAGSQLTGKVLDSGVVLASIDFTSKGCFQVPDQGMVIIRSQDLKLSRSLSATELHAIPKLILRDDDATRLLPSEPLRDRRSYFGETFYFVDPGYVLNFYSDENLKNIEIEYCIDEIKDPDEYDFDTVECLKPNYYYLDNLPRLDAGLWSVRYRKRTSPERSDWNNYLLAVRVECEGVVTNLEEVATTRCTDIDNLEIKGPGSLEHLKYVSKVTGNLKIEDNDSTSLRGIRNISSTGDLSIRAMSALRSLDIPPLSIKASISLVDNAALEDVDGLAHLGKIERHLSIYFNNSLRSIKGLRNIKAIGGDLDIDRNTKLDSLDGLSQLERVGGKLNMAFSENTKPAKGLTQLRRVGALSIGLQGDDSTYSLAGLNNLERVDGSVGLYHVTEDNLEVFSKLTYIGDELTIIGGNIKTLKGLRNLKYLKSLSLIETSIFTADGFEDIEKIDGPISLRDNSELVSIKGFSNLKRIGGDLSLSGHPLLSSIGGFARLEDVGGSVEVYGNEKLTTLDGLSGLRSVGSIYLENNSALLNLDPILGIESIYARINIQPFSLCQVSNLINHAGKPLAATAANPHLFPSQLNEAFQCSFDVIGVSWNKGLESRECG